MSATEAQLSAVAAVDPLLAKSAGAAALDFWFDRTPGNLNTNHLPDPVLAQTLWVCHQIRLTNPNVGGGPIVGVGESAGGSRTKSTMNLPAGYPADWYTTSPGCRLIGLMAGSNTLPLATG